MGVPRLKEAGMDVIVNASVLGIGLLRGKGVPEGVEGDRYPSPRGLRTAVRRVYDLCEERGEIVEDVTRRYAIENWLSVGAEVGTRGELELDESGGQSPDPLTTLKLDKFGASVVDVSTFEELEETMRIWKSILDASKGNRGVSGILKRMRDELGAVLEDGYGGEETSKSDSQEQKSSLERREQVNKLGKEARVLLGEWTDYAWESPGKDYVNIRKGFGPNKEEQEEEEEEVKAEEGGLLGHSLVSGTLNMIDQ